MMSDQLNLPSISTNSMLRGSREIAKNQLSTFTKQASPMAASKRKFEHKHDYEMKTKIMSYNELTQLPSFAIKK